MILFISSQISFCKRKKNIRPNKYRQDEGMGAGIGYGLPHFLNLKKKKKKIKNKK
jgi:hypothetical protein